MTEPVFTRSAGILLHPTSLPGRYGIGDFGRGALVFIDWLVACGLSRWQVLPLVPAGPGNSPYSSPSAFAGNPMLIDPDSLYEDGLLDQADLEVPDFPIDFVDWERVVPYKQLLLQKAAARLVDNPKHRLFAAFDAARRGEPGASPSSKRKVSSLDPQPTKSDGWIQEYAFYIALKDYQGGKPWWEWPEALAQREPETLAKARSSLAREIDLRIAEQVLFDDGWKRLRAYANEHGVKIVGDIPIYVDRDSADVWSRREQFQLDASGRPLAVAGVPPDLFSETGQLWGNPLYDWAQMARDGHSFFVERLRRVFELTDIVRIDHFRAFADYWAVPYDAPDARAGKWVLGPGQRIFEDLRKALGELPIIVEDLGLIDQRVVDLRQAVGLPGMKVLQYAFGEGADHPYLPHNYDKDWVVYTGTHDTETTLGWYRGANETVRDHVRRYLGSSGDQVVWDLIRVAFASVAHTAIVPLQDVLVLDNGSRMNIPGRPDGNWGWRVRSEAFNEGLSRRLHALSKLYDRDEAERARRPRRG